MKKKTKKTIWIVAIVLVVLIAIVTTLAFVSGGVEQFLEVDQLFDSNGNLIGDSLSVVGGIEGVKFITLKINVNNLDTVPLTLFVKDMTPTEIISAKPVDSLNVNPGETGSWVTGLIDIESYEGTIQSFCVTVESEQIPALREISQVSGCIDVKVDPNPVANFDISLDSNVDEGDINPGCEEDWSCSEWSSCTNSIQTRTCSDINECGTESNKPGEQQACEVVFQTNAMSGDYSETGVWIDFGNGMYNYGGSSSYDCLNEEIIATTPEGNAICTRPGYDINSRVYLQEGNSGLIFEP